MEFTHFLLLLIFCHLLQPGHRNPFLSEVLFPDTQKSSKQSRTNTESGHHGGKEQEETRDIGRVPTGVEQVTLCQPVVLPPQGRGPVTSRPDVLDFWGVTLTSSEDLVPLVSTTRVSLQLTSPSR